MTKPPRTNIDKLLDDVFYGLLKDDLRKDLKQTLLTYIKELCEFEKLVTVNPKTQIRNQLRQEILKQAEEELDGS